MTGHRRVVALTAFLHAVLFAGDGWAQCAMCRQALASPEGQQLVAALRSGILILLAAPFVLFTTVAALAIRSQRRRLGNPANEPRARHVP